jgi:soluble lytic murein transglycosylase
VTPSPTAADRRRFKGREIVQVVERLAAAGHQHRARAFLIHLAETVDTPGEVALAATLARRIGQPQIALEIGKAASRRGMQVGALAMPLIVIPSNIPVPDSIDRAVVYAIARQESAFNVGAKSWAGARGLMQMMPATAKSTAKSAGRPFSLARLSSDARYSATLGAHHLGELMDDLRGSYIMTFAGYNAGPGRAIRWVRKYGDPRGGRVDPVDWVERIPFDETRDYVQRVMANLQAYRSRLGHALAISRDLKHGRPVK